MSVESMAIVLHHSRATGTAKLVLLGIANHDGDGGAWPSVDTLAKYANVHRRNVQRAIEKLEELKELVVVRNGGGSHSTAETHRPNLYRVTVRCPSTCDRTAQHRTGRQPQFDLTPPGVASAPPRGVSAAPGVASAPPEPPTNQTNHLKETAYSTRACKESPTREHHWEDSGWCAWGAHKREVVNA